VAASFLSSVVDVLAAKGIEATRRYRLKRLVVVGGVAASLRLRQELARRGKERSIEVAFPPPALCTDNAAMIASAGAFHHLVRGESHPLSLAPAPSLSF
jgi:N6-L-threonylcarbamoyladenine synthase